MKHYDAIESFFARTKQMQTGRSKEMRMTYEEAQALALAIGQLLVKEAKANAKEETGPLIISGGSLKPA